MKQVLQGLGNGETVLETLPAPMLLPGTLLIETRRTLISAGTERMLVEFGKSSLVDKARKNPERVRQVLNKVRTDGVLTTVEAVRSKLAQQIPLGYCNAGTVIGVGAGVEGFAVGDRVASNGSHAELVRVPANLCAKIPDGISDDAAAFTVLAAIGLQGIRLANPTLGESVVVIGLGLVGLVTVQLLRANGCRVIGLDPDAGRCALAERFGAKAVALADGVDPVAAVMAETSGIGADAVIIAASTDSNGPIEQSAQMSRKRGRIVLVGVVGLHIAREMFYRKELTFQVSCSYGPGRYDDDYEQRGNDYPIAFVRWTERRNFDAVLGLMAQGTFDPMPLVTHHFPIADVERAYSTVSAERAALGILLDYEPGTARAEPPARTVQLAPAAAVRLRVGTPVAGFLGFGNYASRVLAPAFKTAGFGLGTIVTTGGPVAATEGKRLGFAAASTDRDALFADPAIDLVAIATRHDDHAQSVVRGLEAGKAVFVEKPLATDLDGLAAVEAAYAVAKTPFLMAGYNRRFAPHTQAVKTWLDRRSEPAALILLMNAGKIPAEHWTQDAAVGGGRIIGEACHLIDLSRYLIGHPITEVHATALGGRAASAALADTVSIALGFADGSTAVVHYLANGSNGFPKERVEVFCGGGIAAIDNFVAVKGWDTPGLSNKRLLRQDKGQEACAVAVAEALRSGGPSPIPFAELVEVAAAAISAAEQAAAT